ncbi:MAG TPA: Lrp/AsnC family transcriptional regulator [Candidatus Limnocylindrales bacterium]|nr:Lrp/AsnC family transcriptional regulator [Candidatus Limnocylindrales bacterium]
MRKLDEQELKIAKALVRNPRLSDNRLGELYDIPVRTVSRKRARMEQEGLLRYFAEVDMAAEGTGCFSCSHLYIIQFKVGVTVSQIQDEIRNEPNVVTVFTELIRESYIAEISGRVALVMVVEGTSDRDVVESFQQKIVPSLQKNHGKDSIEDVSTIRLLSRVRILRNYLPSVNMENGMMKPDWSTDSIFVA